MPTNGKPTSPRPTTEQPFTPSSEHHHQPIEAQDRLPEQTRGIPGHTKPENPLTRQTYYQLGPKLPDSEQQALDWHLIHSGKAQALACHVAEHLNYGEEQPATELLRQAMLAGYYLGLADAGFDQDPEAAQ